MWVEFELFQKAITLENGTSSQTYSNQKDKSINDSIGQEYCSLEYTTVDKVVAKATALVKVHS